MKNIHQKDCSRLTCRGNINCFDKDICTCSSVEKPEAPQAEQQGKCCEKCKMTCFAYGIEGSLCRCHPPTDKPVENDEHLEREVIKEFLKPPATEKPEDEGRGKIIIQYGTPEAPTLSEKRCICPQTDSYLDALHEPTCPVAHPQESAEWEKELYALIPKKHYIISREQTAEPIIKYVSALLLKEREEAQEAIEAIEDSLLAAEWKLKEAQTQTAKACIKEIEKGLNDGDIESHIEKLKNKYSSHE